jgi:hypothetical protein
VGRATTDVALVGRATTAASATLDVSTSDVGTAGNNDKRKAAEMGGAGPSGASMGGVVTSSSMFCAMWRMLTTTLSVERR